MKRDDGQYASPARLRRRCVRPIAPRHLIRSLLRRLPPEVRGRLRTAAIARGWVPPPRAYDDDTHPERLAALGAVRGGRVLEVGCGYRKSDAQFVGVDLIAGGQPGLVGNVAGKPSQADVAAEGARLPFADATFDTLVARHNLEHYVDLVAVLDEWGRVLRPQGRLVLVVPDEERYPGRTVELDPTHYHAFTASSLTRLLRRLGWNVLIAEPCIPAWSLVAVAERPLSLPHTSP